MRPCLTIYTDGACKPNPGPGGWGAVILRKDQAPVKLSGGEHHTTNNRMELKAAIAAISSVSEPHQLEIFTDSKYLKRGITEWLPRWKKRDWQTLEKTAVKNQDLWQALAQLVQQHDVRWKWLKGHGANQWNETADALARAAIPKPSLPLKDNQSIHIFAAVSFETKTNRGGWSVILRFRQNVKAIHGHAPNTTGNRMHLQSAIEGLTAIKKNLPIHFYTYSRYLRDGITQWIDHWSKRSWQTNEGHPVRHRDLWIKVHQQTQRYRIQWHIAEKKAPPCELQEAKILAKEALDLKEP